MTKKTNAKVTAAAKARAVKAKRAPGNATALRQKAADNLTKLNKGKGKAETIKLTRPTEDGGYIYVEGSKGNNFVRSRRGDSKAFRERTAIGALYDPALAWHTANPEPKPQAQMARGTDSHTAPHSAKAVADQKRDAKAEPKGKATKAAAPKAAKNKQPSRGAERSYTLGKTKNEARPDTWRYYMLQTIMAHKDTASAKAAHAKSRKFSDNKLDFTWADQKGYIKFSK